MKNLIIDGNNLVHRCFWVANNQVKGEDSYLHVYMVLNSIKTYVEKFKPDKIYCCWDEKKDYGVNERKDMFADYKGNRDREYSAQVHSKNEHIKHLLSCLGIKNFFPLRLEADDCMAFLSKELPGKKVIVTVDKDLCQCIDKHVIVYDPIKKYEITFDNFLEIMKVTKEHYLIEKCFKGDKSDNVPGVTGMGKKKIKKYFDGEYHTSAEQSDEFKRNYELFRLDKYTIHKDEHEWYKEQLDIVQKHDFKQFKLYCEELKLDSILKKQDRWYDIFCFGSDYESHIMNLLK
jgi:5'-3' exonuclease